MKLLVTYSHVLDNIFRKLQSLEIYPEQVEIIQRSIDYQDVCERYQSTISEAYHDMLGLSFSDKLIKVFIVGKIPHSISSPIIIHSRMDNERFLYVLCHELTHVLMSENKEKRYFAKRILETYPNESLDVGIHIVVNAVLQKLFLIYFDMPKLITDDKQISSGNPLYKRAWDVVELDGYEKILDKIFA